MGADIAWRLGRRGRPTVATLTSCGARLHLLIGSAIITAVELGMLRLGDAPLLAAGARDTVRVTAWRGCYLQCVSWGV